MRNNNEIEKMENIWSTGDKLKRRGNPTHVLTLIKNRPAGLSAPRVSETLETP